MSEAVGSGLDFVGIHHKIQVMRNILAALICLFIVSNASQAAAKAPYLIFVHGGAWVSGAPEQYASLAKAFESRGYCVVLAKYTLAPAARHPVPVRELNETIGTTAKTTSAKCDEKRIYLIGHSAGAHMISFWNTAYKNRAVKGFVGIEGIYDLPLLTKNWPAYEKQFVDAEFGTERVATSPARLKAKSNSPWLLIQSRDDELVDRAQTETFEKSLRTQKISSKSIELSGSHFGVLKELEQANSKISQALTQFIGE